MTILHAGFTPEQRAELKEIVRESMNNARVNGYGELVDLADSLDAAFDMFDFDPQIEKFMDKHSLDPDGFLGSCANIIDEIREENKKT